MNVYSFYSSLFNNIMTFFSFIFTCTLILVFSMLQPSVCSTQAFFRKDERIYLANYVIERKQKYTELQWALSCAVKDSCSSVNFKTAGKDRGLCELNNNTFQKTSNDDEKKYHPEFDHFSIIDTVSKILFCSFSC